VQPGVLLLARRSGLPICPLGIAVDRAWVFRSWDAFVLPKPGARIALVVGPEFHPNEFGDRSTQELCAELKSRLMRATEQAQCELQQW
jgi:hypothetical protein